MIYDSNSLVNSGEMWATYEMVLGWFVTHMEKYFTVRNILTANRIQNVNIKSKILYILEKY